MSDTTSEKLSQHDRDFLDNLEISKGERRYIEHKWQEKPDLKRRNGSHLVSLMPIVAFAVVCILAAHQITGGFAQIVSGVVIVLWTVEILLVIGYLIAISELVSLFGGEKSEVEEEICASWSTLQFLKSRLTLRTYAMHIMRTVIVIQLFMMGLVALPTLMLVGVLGTLLLIAALKKKVSVLLFRSALEYRYRE